MFKESKMLKLIVKTRALELKKDGSTSDAAIQQIADELIAVDNGEDSPIAHIVISGSFMNAMSFMPKPKSFPNLGDMIKILMNIFKQRWEKYWERKKLVEQITPWVCEAYETIDEKTKDRVKARAKEFKQGNVGFLKALQRIAEEMHAEEWANMSDDEKKRKDAWGEHYGSFDVLWELAFKTDEALFRRTREIRKVRELITDVVEDVYMNTKNVSAAE